MFLNLYSGIFIIFIAYFYFFKYGKWTFSNPTPTQSGKFRVVLKNAFFFLFTNKTIIGIALPKVCKFIVVLVSNQIALKLKRFIMSDQLRIYF